MEELPRLHKRVRELETVVKVTRDHMSSTKVCVVPLHVYMSLHPQCCGCSALALQ